MIFSPIYCSNISQNVLFTPIFFSFFLTLLTFKSAILLIWIIAMCQQFFLLPLMFDLLIYYVRDYQCKLLKFYNVLLHRYFNNLPFSRDRKSRLRGWANQVRQMLFLPTILMYSTYITLALLFL